MQHGTCNPCDVTGIILLSLLALVPAIVIVCHLVWWARHRDYHSLGHESHYGETEKPERGLYCRSCVCTGRGRWYNDKGDS